MYLGLGECCEQIRALLGARGSQQVGLWEQQHATLKWTCRWGPSEHPNLHPFKLSSQGTELTPCTPIFFPLRVIDWLSMTPSCKHLFD